MPFKWTRIYLYFREYHLYSNLVLVVQYIFYHEYTEDYQRDTGWYVAKYKKGTTLLSPLAQTLTDQ
jgi:hypothetical protein